MREGEKEKEKERESERERERERERVLFCFAEERGKKVQKVLDLRQFLIIFSSTTK